MAVASILEEIENDVRDVVITNFVYNNTRCVPNRSDEGLTYEKGQEKKGKEIETCVLYVDIRNSVALTEKHHNQTMGRVYTAFTKAVLKVARHHNGHTRNIIGDRVMVVFPSENCFTNAVECAISINHISKKIINKHFNNVDFKCGIGIDFGNLRVIKVGIQRRGYEKGENKGLVWVGYPANIASRLTDVANKTIEDVYFEVTRNPINNPLINNLLGALLMWQHAKTDRNTPYAPIPQPYYSNREETVEMTVEQFAASIYSSKDGELSMEDGRFIRFSKKTRTLDYPEILMTEKVYTGFKKNNSKSKCILENYWHEQTHQIKNVPSKIYGGNVLWDI